MIAQKKQYSSKFDQIDSSIFVLLGLLIVGWLIIQRKNKDHKTEENE